MHKAPYLVRVESPTAQDSGMALYCPGEAFTCPRCCGFDQRLRAGYSRQGRVRTPKAIIDCTTDFFPFGDVPLGSVLLCLVPIPSYIKQSGPSLNGFAA